MDCPLLQQGGELEVERRRNIHDNAWNFNNRTSEQKCMSTVNNIDLNSSDVLASLPTPSVAARSTGPKLGCTSRTLCVGTFSHAR